MSCLELVAPYNNGTIAVQIVAAPSTSMAQLKRIARSASEKVLSLPSVAAVWCRAGGEDDDTFYFADPGSSRETITMTVTIRYGRRPDSRPIVEALRRLLAIEGCEVTVSLPRSSLAQLLGLGASGYELSVLGQTPTEARSRAEEVSRGLRAQAPHALVRVSEAPPLDELRYTPNRETLARSGVTLATVAQTTWEGLEGAVPTRLSSGGREYDVRILLAAADRSDRAAVAAVRIRTPRGAMVETGDVVHLEEGQSRSALVRENRQDVCAVLVDAGASPPSTLADAVSKATRNAGVTDTARTVFSRHAPDIALILAVALLLLYLFLGAQFESFVQPLIILVAVPLAATGVFASLLLTGQSLNLSSGLGVLVLLGTVVKTSIILFANYRRRIDAGAPASFAVYSGASERLRPILISTFATIFALLPIAINLNGLSSEDGIAIAVIGGLVVSTALTLYAVPLITWGYYRARRSRSARSTRIA